MANKVKKSVILTSGEVRQINYDTIPCPMCLNGRMNIKGTIENEVIEGEIRASGDEWLLMECPTCRTQVHVPFVNITEEPLDE